MKLSFVRGNKAEAELSNGTIDAVAIPAYDYGHPLYGLDAEGSTDSGDGLGRIPRQKIIRIHVPLAVKYESNGPTAGWDWSPAFDREIESAYHRALAELGVTWSVRDKRVVLGMPLLLVAGSEKEIAASLECLLRACVRYTGLHGSLTYGLGMIKELRVYCSESAYYPATSCLNRRCVAFMDGPLVWDGFGDVELWHLLMHHFMSPRYDAMGPLDVLVECQRETMSITGAPLDGANHQRFLSKLDEIPRVYEASPAVAQLGLPILISNMVDLNMDVHDGGKPRFIVETELMRGEDKPSYKLRLPHDMIPLLEGLRGQVQDYTTRTHTYLDPRERVSLTSYRLHGSRFVVRYTLSVEASGNGSGRYDFDYRCGYSLCAALGCRVSELENKLRDYCHGHGTRALVGLVESCMQKWESDRL
ncbi:MAG: hypothetical protein Q4B54_13730 [Coriobacteriales bacterium]|nr:hypothetical protein [Coriobacteriales bacterium]